jgi:hypothetical protein
MEWTIEKMKTEVHDGKWDPERLEGMDAIREVIDPNMSKSTFYRRHRKDIEYILIERENWWKKPVRCKYFTFRRLLYAYMLNKKVV